MSPIIASILTLAVIVGSLSAAEAPAVEKTKVIPYPLDTCIVSGDKLGSMGDSIVIVRENQEIKLCCKGCIADVDKDVAKYLKNIKEAAAKKAEDAAKAAAKDTSATSGAKH